MAIDEQDFSDISAVRVIDFETSGIPSETETHAIVEVGWCDITRAGSEWSIGEPHSILANPGRPIPIEARAVHHISDADVASARTPDQVLAEMMTGAAMFCAHNIDFERKFFSGGSKPWICTFKTALRIWPEAPSHSNQALRYFLGVDDEGDFDRRLTEPVHRAAPDAYVTAHILRYVLAKASINDLVRWSAGPALLARMPFGKHAKQKWDDVPTSYLEWIVDKSGMDDRDVKATAKHHLKLRQNAGGGNG